MSQAAIRSGLAASPEAEVREVADVSQAAPPSPAGALRFPPRSADRASPDGDQAGAGVAGSVSRAAESGPSAGSEALAGAAEVSSVGSGEQATSRRRTAGRTHPGDDPDASSTRKENPAVGFHAPRPDLVEVVARVGPAGLEQRFPGRLERIRSRRWPGSSGWRRGRPTSRACGSGRGTSEAPAPEVRRPPNGRHRRSRSPPG